MHAHVGLASYPLLRQVVMNLISKITSVPCIKSQPVLMLALWIASLRNNNLRTKHIFLRNALVGGALYGMWGLNVYLFPTGMMLVHDLVQGASEAVLLTGLFKYFLLV